MLRHLKLFTYPTDIFVMSASYNQEKLLEF
jgi:hypothetical protein